MPTPFYHLSLAEELLDHPHLPGVLSRFLYQFRGEFLFGSTAPDVQVVSRQPRVETHFFDLPIRVGDPPAWKRIQDEYVILANPTTLPAAQAAFVAGYLCHLQADWLWVKDIFARGFGLQCSWGTFSERLYYHNVLRAYLDRQILPGLPGGIDNHLSGVAPRGWLPFVEDRYLVEWRDLIAAQLKPGASVQTVEVFSARQNIDAPEFYALLASKERLEMEVFAHMPLAQVEDYRQFTVHENIQLLSSYYASCWQPFDAPFAGRVFQGVRP